jgi:hypothetical protein
VLDGNNFTSKIDGKEYHFLTITPTTHEAMIDPIGMAVGFMVGGYIYGFRRKENRDAVFKYVKKFCKLTTEQYDKMMYGDDDDDEKDDADEGEVIWIDDEMLKTMKTMK